MIFNLFSRQWFLYFRIFHEKLIFWRRQALSREGGLGLGEVRGSGSYTESSCKTNGLMPCWCLCWHFSFPHSFLCPILSLQVKLTFKSESPELTAWSQAGLMCNQPHLWNHWGSFWLTTILPWICPRHSGYWLFWTSPLIIWTCDEFLNKGGSHRTKKYFL